MTYANPFDWVSLPTSIFLLLSGIILFPVCFWLQQYWWRNTAAGKAFIKTYQLTEKDTIDISNKIVSAVQALCAGVSGIIVVRHCHDKVLSCRETVAIGYAWFGIPYFMYDTLCMFYVYTFSKRKTHNSELNKYKMTYLLSKAIEFGQFAMYSPVIFIHHVIMAHIGWTLILFYRDAAEPGDFFVGVMYMMEFSTPFVSIRFILSKLKMKSSKWYAINGIIMLIAFPIFRILSVVYAALLFTWQNNHANIFQGIMGVPVHWRTIWTVAMTPQLYWYYLMVRGVIKMYSKPNDERTQELILADTGGVGCDGAANCNEISQQTETDCPAESNAKLKNPNATTTPVSYGISNTDNKFFDPTISKLD